MFNPGDKCRVLVNHPCGAPLGIGDIVIIDSIHGGSIIVKDIITGSCWYICHNEIVIYALNKGRD